MRCIRQEKEKLQPPVGDAASVAYSTPSVPLIPEQACHPFQRKAATDSRAKLPRCTWPQRARSYRSMSSRSSRRTSSAAASVHGILRVRCETCHAEQLVAFSCCPTCGSRRMVETATLLVILAHPVRYRSPNASQHRWSSPHTPAPEAGAAVPLHQPPGGVGKAPVAHREWERLLPAEDPVPRRYDARHL